MAKKKVTDVVLVIMSVLILLGVALVIYDATRDRSVIRVNLKPSVTEAVEFDNLYLLPGESCEYKLAFSSEVASPCSVELKLTDRAPAYTLKDYAYVRIEKGDEVLTEQRLADAFAAPALTTTVDMADEGESSIIITFYLPAEVGNEVQNAEADFALLITASNE